MEITVRGLCADINRLDAARASKDEPSIKRMEETMSKGLVLLSKILVDNLTLHRECILTAFSLTPTNRLFQKLTELAEQSHFVDMSPNTDDVLESEEKKRLQGESVPIDFLRLDFDKVCEQEEAELAKGYGNGRSFRPSVHLKHKRNLEGLISVQVKRSEILRLVYELSLSLNHKLKLMVINLSLEYCFDAVYFKLVEALVLSILFSK